MELGRVLQEEDRPLDAAKSDLCRGEVPRQNGMLRHPGIVKKAVGRLGRGPISTGGRDRLTKRR